VPRVLLPWPAAFRSWSLPEWIALPAWLMLLFFVEMGAPTPS
jgi:hypothetical protein